MKPVPDPIGGTSIPLHGRETMWADTTQLYASAYEWEWTNCLDLYGAGASAGEGRQAALYFGTALRDVASAHDAFMVTISDLLADAASTAKAMGRAIRETADDFVKTDEGAAEVSDRQRAKL